MFEDENRPLYKLCWKIALERISIEHYQSHIQRAAKALWKKPLTDETLDSIINLSERHPFYINKLCDRLWSGSTKQPPTLQVVESTWHKILLEEKSDAVKEISLLSAGQKNVLLQLAKNPLVPITSKQSMLSLQMTSSSIITALEGLEEKDMIEKTGQQYQIINPVVKHYVLTSGKID
jgi:hypothetical protein